MSKKKILFRLCSLASLLLASALIWAQSPPLSTLTLTFPLNSSDTPATQANLVLIGNPGPNAACYWLVSHFTLGEGIPQPIGCLNALPNSLSASNYVVITPLYPAGVHNLDVLKTPTLVAPSGACNCAVATAVTSGSINDQSNSTSSYTLSAYNVTSFNLTLDNEVVGAGSTHLILRQNGVFVSDLSTGGGGGSTNFQVDGVPVSNPTTINFQDAAITNGLTLSFSNPSLGNVQLGLSGILTVPGGGTGAGLLTGILKGNGASPFTAAVAADVVGLFSTCSGTQYLGADGACHSAGTGTITGGGAVNTIPIFTGPSALGNSLITQASGNIDLAPTGVIGLQVLQNTSTTCSGGAPPNSFGCTGAFIQPNLNSASGSGTSAGLQVQNGFISGAGTLMVGLDAFLQNRGFNMTEQRGVESDVTAGGSGATIGTSRAFYGTSIIQANTTGVQQGLYLQTGTVQATITNNYGVYVDSPAITGASGVLTHNYGLYIADQTPAGSGTNSDPWGIFEAGSAKNQLGGALTVLGNLTTNMSGGPFCVHEIAGVLSATGSDCGSGGGMVYPSGNGFAIVSGGTSWGTTLTDPLPIGHGGTGATDQIYVDATTFSGADACAKIAAAGVSLNSNTRGGTVDARGFTGTQACASNPFAGVTSPVKFLFAGATWNTTAQWSITCSGCSTDGLNWSSSVVVATTGFPTNTAIFNIGDGTNTFFDARFNHMQADCGNTPIVGCYGFQGQGTDEGSGVSFLRVRNCNAANAGGCVKVNSAPSTSNYTMDHVYVLFNTSASTTADGVAVTGTSSQGTWDAVTIIGAGAGTTGHAFHCAGTFTGCKVRSLHFESMSDGAYWNSTSWGYLHGAVGDPTNNSGAAVLHINTTSTSYGIDYADLMSVNTTYILKNDVTGESISGTTNSGNVSLAHGSYPSQAVDTLTDSSGNPFIKVNPTASAVDGVTVTNAATGSPATVTIAATGSDTNINLNLISKGTGTVQCNGSTCGTGGSGLSGMVALGFPIPNSATTINSSTTPGTNQGTYLPVRVNTVQGTAASPTEQQVGIGGRALTGAATTDTVLYTDVNQVIDHDQGASAGVTETIPTPATLNNTSFGFIYWNHSAQTDTLKATTNTIQLGQAAAVAGATGVSIGPGQIASVKQDPNLSTQWLVNIVDQAGYINGGAMPASAKLLGSNSSSQPIAAALTSAHLYVGNGSNLPADVAVSGDISLTNAGVATVTQIEAAAIPVSAALLATNSSKQLTAVTAGTGVITALGVNTGSAGAFGLVLASGTSAMGTGAISSGTCATVVTTTATGAATTDNLVATPTADPTGVTGYAPSASGSLYIQSYITSGNVNFKVCNNTSGSITPSALTLQWRVIR